MHCHHDISALHVVESTFPATMYLDSLQMETAVSLDNLGIHKKVMEITEGLIQILM